VDVFGLIALIVSVIALLVSGFSAWYTRREARAAEGVLELEKKRELERTRPTIQVDVVTLDPDAGPWNKLEIQNRGVRTLDSVKLEILEDDWGRLFKFDGGIHEIVTDSIGPGDTRIIPITRPERIRMSYPIRMLATYRAGEDEWQQLLERRVGAPLRTILGAAD
jgi:hypothetical protein